ncbi:MAG: HD domain-containing phosphohydrolase [Phycisphaerales bacterium]
MQDFSDQHILFVDDEQRVLQGIKRLLHSHKVGWTLHFASSVDEALERAVQLPIDLIISDYNMPVRDGIDLIIAVKELPETADIPIVILTGNAESDLKSRALHHGALDLLNKPVNREDLIARMQSALKFRKCQTQLQELNRNLEERVEQRTNELELARNELIWRLSYAVEARDEDTGAHIARVAACTKLIATSLGLERKHVNEIYIASVLHDIGKISIPDSVLHKPSGLDQSERELIEGHCQSGWDILTHQMHTPDSSIGLNPFLNTAAEIALSHHEHWDGSGYPSGHAGEDIPLSGRIVATADVLDALCSKRSYKPVIPFDESFAMLTKGSGKQFDPTIIQACIDCKEELRLVLFPEDHQQSSEEFKAAS